MASTSGAVPKRRFLAALTNVERHEWAAVALSFLLVLVLMTSYTILRPVRDALGGDWGNAGLALTWTANFVVSLLAVSVYGFALTHVRFRVMVPGVYVFFALTFASLFVLRNQLPDPQLVNKIFYVWVSVFSLFNLSVFWSFMTDVFDSEQATRLFGFFAAGTTVGAIAGPSITTLFVDSLGVDGLLLLSAGLLCVPVLVIPALWRLKETSLGNAEVSATLARPQALGTDWYAGFRELARDPYLLGIAAFILLYVTISTFVYFELQNLTSEYSLEFRAKVWALMDLTTQALTLLIAALVTGRIVRKFGMPTALAIMPVLIAVGVLALVLAPTLLVLGLFQVGRRVGNYAITRPSREMLFTVLDREARFKSKPVIDVVVYRAGDVATSWIFTLLVASTGLGLAGIAVVISGVAIAWGAVAVWVGRRYLQRAAVDADAHEAPSSALPE